MGQLTTFKQGYIKCPLCKKGKVLALFFEAVKFEKRNGFVAYPAEPKQRIKVIEDCPKCHATAEKIMASFKK